MAARCTTAAFLVLDAVTAAFGVSVLAHGAFRDGFDSPAEMEAWSPELGRWELRDGAYHEVSRDYRTLTLREGGLYDFDLTVRVQFLEVRREYETAGYAVVAFRAQDADRYYAVVARQRGGLEVAELNRYPSPTRPMWQPIARLEGEERPLGEWFSVTVRVRGTRVVARAFGPGEAEEECRVEADLGAVRDLDHSGEQAYVRGRIGLGASYAHVAFDDLEVRPRRSIAELMDALSVVRERTQQAKGALRRGSAKEGARALASAIQEFETRLARSAPKTDAEWAELDGRLAELDAESRRLRKQAVVQRGGLAAACSYSRLAGMNAYLGDLNLHTNHSNGAKYPEEAARLYADAGYAFVCFTDEDAYGDQDGGAYYPRLQSDKEAHDWNGDGKIYETRIYGSGVEAYIRDYTGAAFSWVKQNWRLNRPGQFVVLDGITYSFGHPSIACVGHPPGAAFRPRESLGFLDALHKAGGIAFLCHPSAFNDTPEVIYSDENLRRLDGIEIYNGYYARRAMNGGNEDGHEGLATKLWDACLDEGLQMWGFANDYCHTYEAEAADSPFNGFNVVWARALTRQAILEALRNGRFYASSGLLIGDVSVSASTLSVSAEGASGIRVIGDGGRVLTSEEGERLAYELDGSERWLRVELRNDEPVVPEKGYVQRAWLQPIFLDRLLQGRARKRVSP